MASFLACRRHPPRSPLWVSPLRPARASSPLCIRPFCQPVLGCRSLVSFSRLWWEPCPLTGSGALQLGRRGSSRHPHRMRAPRTKLPLSTLLFGDLFFLSLAMAPLVPVLGPDRPIDTILVILALLPLVVASAVPYLLPMMPRLCPQLGLFLTSLNVPSSAACEVCPLVRPRSPFPAANIC